jgi:hypothetical protein
VEVEGLEPGERQRVVRVVEKESELPATGPAMQAFLEFANDVGEVGDGPLALFQHVYPLDRIP